MKSRLARVRSTMSGRNLILGLALVTCSDLRGIRLRVDSSHSLFPRFHDVVGAKLEFTWLISRPGLQ